MFRIVVCSKNPNKVNAAFEIFEEHTKYAPFEIESKAIDSGVTHQPMSLEETIQGAINRAQNGFNECFCSIGIECGLVKVHGKTFMISACSIYRGDQHYIGLSSGFTLPESVVGHLCEGETLNEAALKSGFTTNPELGKAQGMIGVLTKGEINRKDLTKQAIRSALVSMEQ
jgi:inosine/xanthosine triphosphatase